MVHLRAPPWQASAARAAEAEKALNALKLEARALRVAVRRRVATATSLADTRARRLTLGGSYDCERAYLWGWVLQARSVNMKRTVATTQTEDNIRGPEMGCYTARSNAPPA